MQLEEMLASYGIWALIVFMIVKELAPVIANRWFPDLINKRSERELKKLEMEQDNIKHQQTIELRQIIAMEKMVELMSELQALVKETQLSMRQLEHTINEVKTDVDILVDRTNGKRTKRSSAEGKDDATQEKSG